MVPLTSSSSAKQGRTAAGTEVDGVPAALRSSSPGVPTWRPMPERLRRTMPKGPRRGGAPAVGRGSFT
jgi:hypothetical protein